MQTQSPLQDFHPIVRRWFESTFGDPSPPQVMGWPSISSGMNTLILAPTGSGKTLAAFLWAINHLVEQHLTEGVALHPGVRILYVSPLKALNNDIERNLEMPLKGIREEARREGLRPPLIRTAVRTGDTPQSKRQSMIKHPPDILITTPESLYLMLTAKQARKMFTRVQYVIVDEIHSICGNKRGVHLSITLERLADIAEQEFVRIGLSATQRPLDQIASFLGGQQWKGKTLTRRPVNIVDAGQRKNMDLCVECAPPDFSVLPQESVWPLIFNELLELIRIHKTTLVFVNNRRLAERVAAKINEMLTGSENTFNLCAVPSRLGDGNGQSHPDVSEEDPVRAYHGSMSRTARKQMEEDLKAGRLRTLVATSSLELGIDIGSIDLVVQIQSPKGVARGLQRVGRSGHLITATSKGRIFPTHREDLVEASVVARAMNEHDVEHTTIPTNCLDVLAQQIVAMVSVDQWDVDALHKLIRQSFCYQHLSKKLLDGVLQMLSGRYTQEAFRELRARISWDKVNNVLRALPGSSHLAITSGGTIADRGQYGVYLEDGKTKVGEVDEEFVYESRTGDTFILGTNVWRIRSMDPNRLIVSPAPGEPARMPFWRGDGIGRSFELGGKVGEFRHALSRKLNDADCLNWLGRDFPIDTRSAWNIQEYFRKQREIAGVIPHNRQILVEGFRDEIGDPRIVIHSSFGRRVNGLLGLVAVHRLQEIAGVEAQMLYNDDGILLRLSDFDTLPVNLLDGLTFGEAETIVLEDILMSPLFGAQFRQNAARALLLPKLAPGKRTPLWLQRLRAGDLLQIARQFDDFPIVIETIREVLNDVLDFENFKKIIHDIEEGRIQISTTLTEMPSPFAASLLFDFIAVYMYEWDQPRAERQSQYLAINREILAEILDMDSMKSLLRPEAISHVEQQLQHISNGCKARSPEELLQILLRVGDLNAEEIQSCSVPGTLELLLALEQDRRATKVQLAGESRWIAGEDERLYRQLHEDNALLTVIFRYLQSRGPTSGSQLMKRFEIPENRSTPLFEQLKNCENIVTGRFTANLAPGELQWCYRPNLGKIHRQTLALLRKEIKPSSLAEFTHFLLVWQHLHPENQWQKIQDLQECVAQLQGIPLPSQIWEREIFRRRVKDFSSDIWSNLTTSGSFVWVGAGTGRMKVAFRGEGSAFTAHPDSRGEDTLNEPARRVLKYLHQHGASFFADIRGGTKLSLDALNSGIAELFWNGLVTNDLFSELTLVKRPTRQSIDSPGERIEIVDPQHNPRKARLMNAARRAIRQVPGWSGRWSLVQVPAVMGEDLPLEEQARKQALQLLERYGIVAREVYRREEFLPWPLIATELQRMELSGEIRKGYFVEGFSGMQYALPIAVEEIRRLKAQVRHNEEPVLVNACDPANPYGPGMALAVRESRFDKGIRLTRNPGNYVAFERGTPILVLEGFGSRIWTVGETSPSAVEKALASFVEMIRLPAHLRPFKTISMEYCNGLRPVQSPLEATLRAIGFRRDRNQTMHYDGY